MQIDLHLRTSWSKLAILIMSKLNEAQRKAKDYVEEFKIEKVVSEMINSLVHTKDKKPVIFMVRLLTLDQVSLKSRNEGRT